METIIISVGGSVIIPDDIDMKFLKSFSKMIRESDKKFILVTGGGSICRKYLDTIKEIGDFPDTELDWVGIVATRLNGQLLKAILHDISYVDVLNDPTKRIDFKEKVLVGGGWKPGFSSDLCAIEFAKTFGATRVINITDVGHVYDKDPDEFPDATQIDNMTWEQMKDIVGKEWKAGMHKPFDPIATEEAAKGGLKVVIIGKNIENLKKCIDGKEFVGTTIS